MRGVNYFHEQRREELVRGVNYFHEQRRLVRRVVTAKSRQCSDGWNHMVFIFFWYWSAFEAVIKPPLQQPRCIDEEVS